MSQYTNGWIFGAQKTLKLISQNYWQPQLYNFVDDYVRTCNMCCLSKLPCHHPKGLLSLLIRQMIHVNPLPFILLLVSHHPRVLMESRQLWINLQSWHISSLVRRLLLAGKLQVKMCEKYLYIMGSRMILLAIIDCNSSLNFGSICRTTQSFL